MDVIFFNGSENNLNDVDTFYKTAIFTRWFSKKVKKYEHQRNGKCCDMEIIVNKKAFIKTFNWCYKKYMRHYETKNDCICDCICLVWQGMNSFDIQDDSTWKDISDNKNPKNYGKMVTYLNNYVKFEMERRLYPKISTSKTIHTEEGKKQFLVYYNVDLESLNRLSSYKGEKEKVELINIVDKSFWNKNEEYQYSLFMNWAIENMNQVLSKKQLEFMKELEKANYSKLDNDYYEDEISASKSLTRQRIRCIYEKLAKAYAKDKKLIVGGFAVQSLETQLKQLSKITNIIYTKDIELEDMNKEVSKQILRLMNNTNFSNLLYDNLDESSMKTIAKIYLGSMVSDSNNMKLFVDEIVIPSPIIYKVVGIVEDKIEKIETSIRYEMSLLKYESISNKPKTQLVQFDHETSKKCVHLKLNGYGIAVPRYEN